MDIEQLRGFVRVVQSCSFAAAARDLNVAPSMVTRAVASLERQLGVLLVQRTTRRLALTEAGAAYYEGVCEALAQLDGAQDEALALTGQVRGPVRVTASVAFGQSMLLPQLSDLHRRYPALEIELLLTDTVIDLLHERVDIALRLGHPVDPNLVGVRLHAVRHRVVASPAYLQRNGRLRQPGDLAHCDCLRFPMPGFRRSWSFRHANGDSEQVDVRGWLVMSSALALRQAALDGLGPALLGDWLVRGDLAAGTLVDCFADHEVSASGFDSAVWLVYPNRTYLPRRVRVVVDFLRERLGS